jgi:hypothetical protein
MWSEKAWGKLQIVGVLDVRGPDDPDEDLHIELRQCTCGSTIAVRVTDLRPLRPAA